MKNKDGQLLTDHVRGVLNIALDPSFNNPFPEVLEMVSKIDLSEFGKSIQDNLVVEVPITFFAGAGNNKLRLVSLGGELNIMTDKELVTYDKMKLIARLRLAEQEVAFLKQRVEEQENILIQAGYYPELQ